MPGGNTLAATVTLDEAARTLWDVAVSGAGPAGALAARELACRGVSVLLVDRSAFPRDKVCGGCLNASALAVLHAVGLGGLTAQLGGVPLRCVNLSAHGSRVQLPLPGGVSLSRAALDAALVRAAIDAGAAFLPQTSADVRPALPEAQRLGLRQTQAEAEVRARLVLVAAGLEGRCLKNNVDFRAPAEEGSWIGAAASLPCPTESFPAGTIFMATGVGGYVGAVRLENGHLNVAAALDPRAVRSAGGPGSAARRIVAEAGWPPVPGLADAGWQGTPALTRRPLRRARGRVLLLGDAAGYVEPFTGEGIAWALASGAAAAPLTAHALRHPSFDLADAWDRRFRATFGGRHARCRRITRLLRFPPVVRAALAVLALAPGLAALVIDRLNRLPRQEFASECLP